MPEEFDAHGPTIRCGKVFSRVGGELITASQCFDAIGRLLLMDSDADNETLLKVLDTAQLIEAWRRRLSTEEPTLTAAQRNNQ